MHSSVEPKMAAVFAPELLQSTRPRSQRTPGQCRESLPQAARPAPKPKGIGIAKKKESKQKQGLSAP